MWKDDVQGIPHINVSTMHPSNKQALAQKYLEPLCGFLDP